MLKDKEEDGMKIYRFKSKSQHIFMDCCYKSIAYMKTTFSNIYIHVYITYFK